MTTLAEIAAVLDTTEKNALVRVVRMKLYDRYCGRCGGSGQYSFNGSHSRCYSCDGAGHAPIKSSDYPAILKNAEAAVADGRLEIYKRYLSALAITKDADDKVMAAWKASGVSSAYNWRLSYQKNEAGEYINKRDGEISEFNEKMCNAYTMVQTAGRKLNPKSPTYQADVIALAETLAEGLAAVAAADAEFKAYLAANPL